jgi:hypothetical protein
MWTATLSKCSDGSVWIAKTPDAAYGGTYKAFETEREAQAYAAVRNAEDQKREAELACQLAEAEAAAIRCDEDLANF